MGRRHVNRLGLIDHKMIQLTMSLPIGKPTYTVVDSGTELHTGTSVEFVKIAWDGKEQIHYFQGPTLVGLGPQVARAERDRLLLLRQQVDEALASVEGTLAFFDRAQTPTAPSPSALSDGVPSHNRTLLLEVLRGDATPSTHPWMWEDNSYPLAVTEVWATDSRWLFGLLGDPQWPFARRLELITHCPRELRDRATRQLVGSSALCDAVEETRASFIQWLESGGPLPDPDGQAYVKLREQICLLEALHTAWFSAILTTRAFALRARQRAAALMVTELKRTIKEQLRAEASERGN